MLLILSGVRTNSNVKEYIKRQKLRFKKLAQSERLKLRELLKKKQNMK